MRARHLLATLSLLGFTGCVAFPDIPEVHATLTGPATLQVGARAQYVVTITGVGSTLPTTPNAWAIRWKSSDPSAAPVSDLGVVTAVSSGQVTITATPYRGSETGLPGTLTVTLIPCEPPACSS